MGWTNYDFLLQWNKIGALTDRNGLRPGRYTITKDNFIVFSSEVGVIDVPEENVAFKDNLILESYYL